MTDSFGHLETVLIDVAYVKHQQAEIERLKAAFAPTIEVLEKTLRVLAQEPVIFLESAEVRAELARLRAIVKGTE
ncbi:MAG: hypothetical protein WCG75_05730 [Armatimonadota bacterium]